MSSNASVYGTSVSNSDRAIRKAVSIDAKKTNDLTKASVISRVLCIDRAINVRIAAPRIPLYGDEMPVEKVCVMLVDSIINCTE
jgi:hypothetical protein